MDRNEAGARDAACIPSAHFRRLLDDTGIFQHCNGAVPSWQHGYCLDDVARAIVVICGLQHLGDRSWATPLTRCASFVDAALDRPMTAFNFLSFDRAWDGPASEGDHVGRAIWALGELSVLDDPLAGWATDRARRLIDQRQLLGAPLMTRVFALLGLSRLGAGDTDLCSMVAETCTSICNGRDGTSPWPWPEPRLRYDAGRIPQALIESGAMLSRPEVVESGLRLLMWLDAIVATPGPLRVVGHLGLGPAERIDDSGDEQPLEIAALAAAHEAAHRVSPAPLHRARIDQCLAWFHGRNRLSVAMVDPRSGATHDGLGAAAPNSNQGAESTMAYLMTALTARRTSMSS